MTLQLACKTAALATLAGSLLISPSAVAQASFSLEAFVARALQVSDRALTQKESKVLAEMDRSVIAREYEFRWVPRVNLSSSDNYNTQSLGMELQKRTGFGSTLKIGSDYRKQTSDQFSSESPSVYIRLEQGLFRGWGEEAGRYDLNRAELTEKIILWNIIADRQQLIRSSIQSYYTVLLGEMQLEARQHAVERGRENLATAESRHSLGLIPKTDIYRAKLSLLNSEDTLRVDERNVRAAKRELAILIKDNSDEGIRIDNHLAPLQPTTLSDPLGLAIRSRPDWNRLLLEQKLAQISTAQAERALLPDVRLSIGADRYFDEYLDDTGLVNDEWDWRVDLSFSQPLDLSREKAQLQRQKYRSQQIERDATTLKRRIIQSLNDATDTVRLAEQRLDIAQQRLEQAELALDLSQLRFQRGLASNMDLVDAETELQNAQIDIYRQQIALNLAKVDYALACGVLDLAWLEQGISHELAIHH